MRSKAVSLTMAALSVLIAPQAPAEEPLKLTNEKDRVNYAIGVNIVGNFKQQGMEVNMDLVMRGMKDALSGEKLLLTDEELRRAINQYQNALMRKRAAVVARTADNKKEGERFLAENAKKEGVVTLPGGIQYHVLKAGTGKRPTGADTVEYAYRAMLLNGAEAESSGRTEQAVKSIGTGTTRGWHEALKSMPAGSRWRLFVPSTLAYGDRGNGGTIGPGAALIIEVDLIAVK